MWEEGVGKHVRSEEREHVARESQLASEYARTVAVLKRQQGEE